MRSHDRKSVNSKDVNDKINKTEYTVNCREVCREYGFSRLLFNLYFGDAMMEFLETRKNEM